MKLSFLFIAGLMISGLVLVSMTERAQMLTTVIDNVEVTDALVVTDYVIERSTGGPGGPTGNVTINGTRTQQPTPNNDGGHDYRCIASLQICYQCTNCKDITPD